MAASTPEVVFEYIRSVSYPNNKAKHLVGMAKMLIEDFKGVVPSDIDELQKLPGVGRKTANVIASVVYDKRPWRWIRTYSVSPTGSAWPIIARHLWKRKRSWWSTSRRNKSRSPTTGWSCTDVTPVSPASPNAKNVVSNLGVNISWVPRKHNVQWKLTSEK